MKYHPLIFALFFSTNISATEIQAPFGLAWGQSKAEITKQGVTFDKCEPSGTFETCQSTSVPKPLSFGETYFFFISKQKGLQKAGMLSTNVTDDAFGREGKELYSKVKIALEAKYGKSESLEKIGIRLYDERDEFYQCLKYDGCGYWTSYWLENFDGAISIELNGIKRGTGFLRVLYESKDWSKVLEDNEKNTSKSDNEAL